MLIYSYVKNKISFNETGIFAVELAKRIIQDTNHMKTQLKTFDKSLHTFSIGSCAPAPSIHLSQKASCIFSDKTISSEIKDIDLLINGLRNQTYSVIIMPYAINDDHIEAIPFMEEQLYFSLPFSHPLANKESISLKEMDGERMLLMFNIGFWHQMHKRTMPNTKF